MKTMSAKDAKNAFGMLIDSARAEPVTVEKHGRAVVVVIAVEEYERLTAQEQNNKTRGAKVQPQSGTLKR
ncbi:type II toxin-antitoxin system prevent-host-death family antitoxin [Sinorhizobium meliloti]|nr:type II toxin-antitoxin system prevent-host-death family antitoxin [Sinorhizobium meliloti]MDE3779805.1 type II toxin-antitoxin system prevent-host-death family antitoxin [Sinorhizobium meliloti]MDE3807430.1 type II toxin-antitoxin system prevent-host-death family antitoxin [Sinorhizobium meliloti]